MATVHGNESFESSLDFIRLVLSSDKGLDAAKFTSYLKWLFNHADSKEASAGFPLGLYAYTYTEGVEEKTFDRYEDFEVWAKNSALVKNATTLSGISHKP